MIIFYEGIFIFLLILTNSDSEYTVLQRSYAIFLFFVLSLLISRKNYYNIGIAIS